MNELPQQLSVIPIRDIVVLPDAPVRFRVGRESSKQALKIALQSENQIALFSQKDANTEFPEIHDLYDMGVLSKVVSYDADPNNQPSVVVQSLKRIRVFKLIKSSPCFIIQPTEALDIDLKDNIKLPSQKDIKDAVELILKYNPESHLKNPTYPINYNQEPGKLADALIQRATKNFNDQITCLFELNPRKRLKLAYEILIKKGQEAQLNSEINEQVTQAIKDEHREIFLREQLRVILEELGEKSPLSLYNPIFRGKSFKVNPKLLFVLMPFAEEFKPIYSEIIKPIVEQFGLTCIRADDLYGTKAIIEDIWKLINEAKIIIADVTGKNPNVFYEIGLAHAIGKEVIIISQTMEDIPFDLRHLRCFIYQDSVAGFRKLETQLQNSLSSIEGLEKIKPEN